MSLGTTAACGLVTHLCLSQQNGAISHKNAIKNTQELKVEGVKGSNVKFSRTRVLHTSEIMVMLVNTRRLGCQI